MMNTWFGSSFRDQFNRHFCVPRKNLMELGGYRSQVIYDDYSDTHIGRQLP
jgi:hypothetical protein